MNKCVFSGRLVRDVEYRSFASGNGVARFSLAIDNRKKNKETGQWENQAVFLEFDAWGKQGELINEYFHKGDFILIEAKAKVDTWEKEGQKRSRVLFNVDNFEFGPTKQREDAPRVKNNKTTQTAARKNKPKEEPLEEPAFEEADIPF